MNKFEIFGLDNKATIEELQIKYNKLKDEYEKEMLKTGEEGHNAALKLQKLHETYSECLSILEKKSKEFLDIYQYIQDLINKENFSKAQDELDNVLQKDAKWHYLQSQLFEKRNWLEQAIKQINFSISEEPTNIQYKDYYKILQDKINQNNQQETQNQQNTRAGYEKPNQQQGTFPSSCCFLPLCCCL